jgi:hypothetical protein
MTTFESKGPLQPDQPSEVKADGVTPKPKKKARTRGQQLLLGHEIFMPPLSLRKQRNEMGLW